MAFGEKGPFPQQPHTKHKPNGEGVGYVKKSEHVGRGHQDSQNRMTPFGEFPNDPSGEGVDNGPAPSGIPHPLNE